VVDAAGNEVPPGAAGQLQPRGPLMTTDYADGRGCDAVALDARSTCPVDRRSAVRGRATTLTTGFVLMHASPTSARHAQRHRDRQIAHKTIKAPSSGAPLASEVHMRMQRANTVVLERTHRRERPQPQNRGPLTCEVPGQWRRMSQQPTGLGDYGDSRELDAFRAERDAS
jgi:hypothetical protein